MLMKYLQNGEILPKQRDAKYTLTSSRMKLLETNPQIVNFCWIYNFWNYCRYIGRQEFLTCWAHSQRHFKTQPKVIWNAGLRERFPLFDQGLIHRWCEIFSQSPTKAAAFAQNPGPWNPNLFGMFFCCAKFFALWIYVVDPQNGPWNFAQMIDQWTTVGPFQDTLFPDKTPLRLLPPTERHVQFPRLLLSGEGFAFCGFPMFCLAPYVGKYAISSYVHVFAQFHWSNSNRRSEFQTRIWCFLQIKFLGSMIPFVACFLWFLCFQEPVILEKQGIHSSNHVHCSTSFKTVLRISRFSFLGAVEPAIPPKVFFQDTSMVANNFTASRPWPAFRQTPMQRL